MCDADFLFLATDTALARFAFNALCHQYLIRGVLVGAKVAAHPLTGSIESIHVVERPVTLDGPCLDCAGAIPHDLLREEQLSAGEVRAQRYLDGEGAEEVAILPLLL